MEGGPKLIRIGRDGKNRYCLYYPAWNLTPYYKTRKVVMGGLTKLAARKMLDLLGER